LAFFHDLRQWLRNANISERNLSAVVGQDSRPVPGLSNRCRAGRQSAEFRVSGLKRFSAP
jgi:hypothetical protein